ncbi:MAG: glycosyltransferase [Tyzzerella sp.]|nr:glycosyltransferase [Tyzzerella sp.]
MEMYKVSLIVPVYNVEKYLKRCLDSLVTQTLQGIEVIVVNDGTPDNSQQIIDEYVDKYTFVKSYIKENGGLSDARNYGLSKATGEYIAFVDSDDFVEPVMYSSMYYKAKENDYDIVVCDFEEIYDDYVKKGTSRIVKDLKSKEQVKKHMCDVYPSVWNKIYKRELFCSSLKFKTGVWFEDVEWFYRLLPHINSIGVISEPFYKYVQRSGSISRSNDLRIFHYIDNWNGIVDFYKEKKFYNEYYYELEYSYVRYLYATFIKASLKMDWKYYNEAVRRACENVEKVFPDYRRNHYFYKTGKGIYLLLFNKVIAYIYYFLKSGR